MSTKIYNGFKINTVDFNLINKSLKKIKKDYKDIIEIEEKKAILSYIIQKYDSFYYRNKITSISNKESFFSFILNDFNEMNNKLKNDIRVPQLDFGLSIYLFPLNEEVLGYYYSEQKQGKELMNNYIHNNCFIEDYFYFNNTDKPKNITEFDWLIREKKWNNVLSEDNCCYEIQIHETELFPDYSYIEDFQNLEERAHKFVLNEYVEYFLNIANPTIENYNNAIDIIYKNNTKTELYYQMLDRVKKKLNPNLSLNDLTESYIVS